MSGLNNKKYIITEEQLIWACAGGLTDQDEKDVRSHPYKDAIKKERKKIIKDIKKIIRSLDSQYGACDFWSRSTVEEIKNKIESLIGGNKNDRN